MNHDALEAGMFWAGALMALTPLVFAGIVLGVWWWTRRTERKGRTGRTERTPGHD